jgi:hypothetical protein
MKFRLTLEIAYANEDETGPPESDEAYFEDLLNAIVNDAANRGRLSGDGPDVVASYNSRVELIEGD